MLLSGRFRHEACPSMGHSTLNGAGNGHRLFWTKSRCPTSFLLWGGAHLSRLLWGFSRRQTAVKKKSVLQTQLSAGALPGPGALSLACCARLAALALLGQAHSKGGRAGRRYRGGYRGGHWVCCRFIILPRGPVRTSGQFSGAPTAALRKTPSSARRQCLVSQAGPVLQMPCLPPGHTRAMRWPLLARAP